MTTQTVNAVIPPDRNRRQDIFEAVSQMWEAFGEIYSIVEDLATFLDPDDFYMPWEKWVGFDEPASELRTLLESIAMDEDRRDWLDNIGIDTSWWEEMMAERQASLN